MLRDQASAFQCDFETVCTRCICSCGDENTGCTIFKFEICGNIILNFNIMPFSIMAESTNAGWKTADPLQEVEIVRALVQKNAAAFAVPGSAPFAGIVVRLRAVPVGDDPVHAFDLTVFAALYHLVHFAVNTVGTLAEHHTEDAVGFRSCFVHLADLLCINACRFFTHNMKSMLQSHDDVTRMIVVRDSDKNGIAETGFDQFLTGGENGNILRQIFLRPCAAGFFPVGNSGECNFRCFSGVQPRPMYLQPRISCSLISASVSFKMRSGSLCVRTMESPFSSQISRIASGRIDFPMAEICTVLYPISAIFFIEQRKSASVWIYERMVYNCARARQFS